jgi:hypothetical protein
MFLARTYQAKITVAISIVQLLQGADYPKSEPPAHNFNPRTAVRSEAEDIDRCSYNGEARLNEACTEDKSTS